MPTASAYKNVKQKKYRHDQDVDDKQKVNDWQAHSPPKGVGLPLFVSTENIASSLLNYSCEHERKEQYNNGIGSDIDNADRL